MNVDGFYVMGDCDDGFGGEPGGLEEGGGVWGGFQSRNVRIESNMY